VQVSLSAAGRRTVESAVKEFEADVASVTSRLSAADKSHFSKLATRIVADYTTHNVPPAEAPARSAKR